MKRSAQVTHFETGDLDLTVTGETHQHHEHVSECLSRVQVQRQERRLDRRQRTAYEPGSSRCCRPCTLSSVLYVTSVTVDGTDVLGGTVALSAFGGGDLDLGALAAGDDVDVVITIWMDDDATGNMNESVTGDVSFTLNQ